MLVSCSIDNKVIVWRLPETDGEDGVQLSRLATAKILNPFQSLEQHTSFVKVRFSLQVLLCCYACSWRSLACFLVFADVFLCGRGGDCVRVVKAEIKP